MTDPGCWFASLVRSGEPVLVGAVPAAEGHWVSARDDPEPTVEEHSAFCQGVAASLRTFLGEHGLAGAAYVRGDFFVTRSEQLLVYGARFSGHEQALAGAMHLVQAHLRVQTRWRIVCPFGEGPDAAVVIYPDRIFFGRRELDERDLAESVRLIVKREVQTLPLRGS